MTSKSGGSNKSIGNITKEEPSLTKPVSVSSASKPVEPVAKTPSKKTKTKAVTQAEPAPVIDDLLDFNAIAMSSSKKVTLPKSVKTPKAPKAPKAEKAVKAPKVPKAEKVAKVEKVEKAVKAPKAAKVAKVAKVAKAPKAVLAPQEVEVP